MRRIENMEKERIEMCAIIVGGSGTEEEKAILKPTINGILEFFQRPHMQELLHKLDELEKQKT